MCIYESVSAPAKCLPTRRQSLIEFPDGARIVAMEIEGLQTDRLVLRRWCDADREPFAAMNADPIVMRYFPAPLSAAQSNAFVDAIEDSFATSGFGLWAVETCDSATFIGFVGLWRATFESAFTPAIEIGWRLAQPFWGQGYASEAARVVLQDGFLRVGLHEIVSFTSATNQPSRRVMERIGMSHNPAEDFEHTAVAPHDPLRPHVLYRIRSPHSR
jgi:RimJ/RimL family protein N-acetyltransferase